MTNICIYLYIYINCIIYNTINNNLQYKNKSIDKYIK